MLVSVVIPAYNAEKFLAQTIASVFEQTYRQLEIVLVDDGSTDRTVEVAETFLKGSPFPCRILRQPNAGAAGARNRGWKCAHGRWIQFLDADDLLENKKIEVQIVQAQREADADVIYSDWQRLVWSEGAWKASDFRAPIIRSDALADILSDRNFLQLGSLLIRSSVFDATGGFDAEHEPIEDVGLCVKIAIAGGIFSKARSDGPMASYRDLPRSFSKVNQRRFIESCIRNAKLAEEFVRDKPFDSARTVEAIVESYYTGARFFAGTDWDRFDHIVADIEALQPGFTPKAPARLALLSRIIGYKKAERLAALFRLGKSMGTAFGPVRLRLSRGTKAMLHAVPSLRKVARRLRPSTAKVKDEAAIQENLVARRILYVQFTDPAAYPPVEHSSLILAERGWDVVILGIDAFSVPNMKLSAHPRLRVVRLSLDKAAGRISIQYILFSLSCLYWTYRWRPTWIYASDPLALPAVCFVRTLLRVRVVYHEHDSPNADSGRSWFSRMVLKCRKTLARKAELCVVPQQERLAKFVLATGRRRPTVCVWNCPRLGELPEANEISEQDDHLIVYYHGSINRERLPGHLFVAASRLKGAVLIRIGGYEAPGCIGYVDSLKKIVAENDAKGIVEYLGVIPTHEELLRSASKAHVGLSLMPKVSSDVNLRHMVGASNKSFDCMASGLPLLVTDSEDWIAAFVEPGYGRACNPNDADSIEAQLRWYLNNPEKRREMGRRCVTKVRQAWNYDGMFANVVKILETEERAVCK
jgi:glycosyltransferase involved in cell wall biosynthesis